MRAFPSSFKKFHEISPLFSNCSSSSSSSGISDDASSSSSGSDRDSGIETSGGHADFDAATKRRWGSTLPAFAVAPNLNRGFLFRSRSSAAAPTAASAALEAGVQRLEIGGDVGGSGDGAAALPASLFQVFVMFHCVIY